MPPMGTNLATETGAVSQAMIHYYRERAKGGAGLIITEITCVDSPQGLGSAKQLCLHNNTMIPSHNELVEAVKEHGAKIITQLHHAGRQTTPEITRGLQPVAPSALAEPSSNIVPRELTIFEIEDIIEKFVKAAVRAQNAGYDGVELHGAHGYLIGEFMSLASNKRTDLYGGDLEGRMRFPLEIIKGIKQTVGNNFPIIFRYSADEFIKDGIHLEEAKEIAIMLEQAGVDALHVSSGTYESVYTILEPMKYPEAWRAYLAENIKKVVKIPVITVGVIRSPQVAENLLNEGKADFIAIGRTLIADPHWPKKAMEGKEEDIRKCITCNIGCIGERVFKNLHVRCTVNPVAGREHEFPMIPTSYNTKHYAVVGGGPAGMEAARVLASAGNKVTLFERNEQLGGQIKIASVPPGKEKLRWCTDYLETQIRKLGVDIKTNTNVDTETLLSMDIDTVILATGAAPLLPSIEGVNNPNVTTAWEILSGQYEVGQQVIVIGGGSVGCETALYLKNKGVDVTVIEMEDNLATEMEQINRSVFLQDMENAGVKSYTGYYVKTIKPDGVLALDKNWQEHWFPCNHVVISMGSASLNHLERELKQHGLKVITIGDAKKPRSLIQAISDGFMTAYRIIKEDSHNQLLYSFMLEKVYQSDESRYRLQ